MKFGDILKQLREIKGWSQADLARESGIQAPILCGYEANTRDPSIPNLRKLCDALNCNPGTLLGYLSAHPVCCPKCHGKGVIWERTPQRVTLRSTTP